MANTFGKLAYKSNEKIKNIRLNALLKIALSLVLNALKNVKPLYFARKECVKTGSK